VATNALVGTVLASIRRKSRGCKVSRRLSGHGVDHASERVPFCGRAKTRVSSPAFVVSADDGSERACTYRAHKPSECLRQDAGLEPLGRYRGGRGIDAAMKAVFDVLYEADEPFDRDTVAERTFARVHPASHYHARRAVLPGRLRLGKPRSVAGTPAPSDPSLVESWLTYIRRVMKDGARRGTLLREDHLLPAEP
jgi:hypothetical protein